MKKILILIIVVAVIAFISKPSDTSCYAQTKDKYTAMITGDTNNAGRFLSPLAAMVVNNRIRIEDKILYKEIAFAFGKQRKKIGYGAFGHVFFTTGDQHNFNTK